MLIDKRKYPAAAAKSANYVVTNDFTLYDIDYAIDVNGNVWFDCFQLQQLLLNEIITKDKRTCNDRKKLSRMDYKEFEKERVKRTIECHERYERLIVKLLRADRLRTWSALLSENAKDRWNEKFRNRYTDRWRESDMFVSEYGLDTFFEHITVHENHHWKGRFLHWIKLDVLPSARKLYRYEIERDMCNCLRDRCSELTREFIRRNRQCIMLDESFKSDNFKQQNNNNNNVKIDAYSTITNNNTATTTTTTTTINDNGDDTDKSSSTSVFSTTINDTTPITTDATATSNNKNNINNNNNNKPTVISVGMARLSTVTMPTSAINVPRLSSKLSTARRAPPPPPLRFQRQPLLSPSLQQQQKKEMSSFTHVSVAMSNDNRRVVFVFDDDNNEKFANTTTNTTTITTTTTTTTTNISTIPIIITTSTTNAIL